MSLEVVQLQRVNTISIFWTLST